MKLEKGDVVYFLDLDQIGIVRYYGSRQLKQRCVIAHLGRFRYTLKTLSSKLTVLISKGDFK